MSKDSIDPTSVFGVQDRRAAVERANEERAAVRRSRLEGLVSPLLSVRERIELWESLHELRLPLVPGHRLIRVIARDTALGVDQVQAEQLRRKEKFGVGHVEQQ